MLTLYLKSDIVTTKGVRDMLKIKDGVTLKDLEKFGFEKNNYNVIYKTCLYKYWYRTCDKKKMVKDESKEGIIVNLRDNREIFIVYDQKSQIPCFGLGGSVHDLDVIYDLIQTGLVEKV